MRSDVVFNEQGQVTALNLMWTFDDAYAQMALEGLDANGDGVYSAGGAGAPHQGEHRLAQGL